MRASIGTTNQVRLSGTIHAIAHHAAGSGYTIATLKRHDARDGIPFGARNSLQRSCEQSIRSASGDADSSRPDVDP